MSDLHVYAEGYEACLRILRECADWRSVAERAKTAPVNPYSEHPDRQKVWAQGWIDAVAETYAPDHVSLALRECVLVTQSA